MAKEPVTSARKQPTQARARATVDAILQATAHILVKDGYDRLTTNKVAEQAGVSIGSLYQYFPSKEALVSALVDEHIKEIWDIINRELAGSASENLEQSARRLVSAIIEVHRHAPDLHRVLNEQLPRVGGMARIREVDQQFALLVRGALEARKKELRRPDLGLAAFILIPAVKAVVYAALWEDPGLLKGDKLTDELVDLITRYLGKKS
jgi:AcrR family transcriptional regulator